MGKVLGSEPGPAVHSRSSDYAQSRQAELPGRVCPKQHLGFSVLYVSTWKKGRDMQPTSTNLRLADWRVGLVRIGSQYSALSTLSLTCTQH